MQAYLQTRQLREQANARQAAESWVAELQQPVMEGELEPVVLDSITYHGSLRILRNEPGFYQLQVTTSWPGHERKFPFHYRPSL
ncbi:hypothetical protein IV102_33775 [bacterium]|nr:hypothetical protein [bacterium]